MSCETVVMAQSELGCVTVCDCGTVTVHCGNAAMRIPKSHFTAFARMMDEAYANLATRELARKPDNGDDPPKLYPGMGPLCG
jgi:hypothetical protein